MNWLHGDGRWRRRQQRRDPTAECAGALKRRATARGEIGAVSRARPSAGIHGHVTGQSRVDRDGWPRNYRYCHAKRQAKADAFPILHNSSVHNSQHAVYLFSDVHVEVRLGASEQVRSGDNVSDAKCIAEVIIKKLAALPKDYPGAIIFTFPPLPSTKNMTLCETQQGFVARNCFILLQLFSKLSVSMA
jgi:hypothetical protein